jgi:hypothetical protein
VGRAVVKVALLVKVPPGEQRALVVSDAERSFVPPCLGHRGWVGFGLDVGTVDWEEARELLVESYCVCVRSRPW